MLMNPFAVPTHLLKKEKEILKDLYMEYIRSHIPLLFFIELLVVSVALRTRMLLCTRIFTSLSACESVREQHLLSSVYWIYLVLHSTLSI